MGWEFCTVFRNSIRLPSVIEVAIFKINGFSLGAFNDCKNLKHLTLYGKIVDGSFVSPSSYPRLSSLSVNSQPDLARITDWMESGTLKTLSLRISPEEGELLKFWPLIQASSSTMVNLELNLSLLSGAL
jgi:hypothetical protein